MNDHLEPYITQGEPEKQERSYVWHTAIGLQKVDGLEPSEYLIKTANQNINGDITLDEAQQLIEGYYKARPAQPDESRTEEADKVSARIAAILAEKTFSFSPVEYIAIHRRLFEGIYKFAGKIRDWNISKSEWVLDGATVYYASAGSIRDTLDYDFSQEKAFVYKGLSLRQTAEHIAKFISGLWQIHAFGEGNTRTTAVFAIKYLRTFGFDVTNDIFAANAWYFRNALVRANYNDLGRGVHATREHLDRFFGNLLLGEKNELKNRALRITVTADVPVNVPQNVPVKLTSNQERILGILKENGDVTAVQMAEQLGVTDKTVKRGLSALKEAGLIRRVGSDKTGHWEMMNERGAEDE
ncbi:MAG: Fic family protein [Oscillospiraceae bacterium]|jgi:fido (protein-threonine AMPylation protein)/DNA-binding transcriptional ArsR family regulator|nr:Fic family protein [Oscillospiraceae bacterium]